MKNKIPFFITAGELAAGGLKKLPVPFIPAKHLIYSSPATLAFNSPGAEGFGVKRAALAIPQSVLLLVSPACCGRNTTGLGYAAEYRGRAFYLELAESDLVTGRHLARIKKAVTEILAFCRETNGELPAVVMICLTCVDALLGTDMERVCREVEDQTGGVKVRPCYMYALTRDGRRPPLVNVRQSIYSLLAPSQKKSTSANLMGFFSAVDENCEIFPLLKSIGLKNIYSLGAAKSFADFQRMAEANFNLVLHHEARLAAQDLEKRLKIPSIELRRLYRMEKIENQYQALAAVLGAQGKFETAQYRQKAEAAVMELKKDFGGASFAVGEFFNGDAFDLSLALVQYGFHVKEIYATPTEDNWPFLESFAALSPQTKIFANLDPTMLHYEPCGTVDFAIGKDAAYLRPDAVQVHWRDDVQPFGFQGLEDLFHTLAAAGRREKR